MFLAEPSCSYFWPILDQFSILPLLSMFKMLFVISLAIFHDQFEASMNIYRETNFKI